MLSQILYKHSGFYQEPNILNYPLKFSFSLIYDERTGFLALSTVKYGLFYLLASLVPTIIASLHINFTSYESRKVGTWISILCSFVFFPFVQVYHYLQLLINLAKCSAEKKVKMTQRNNPSMIKGPWL